MLSFKDKALSWLKFIISFLRLLTFGVLAMIPFIQDEFVQKKRWLNDEDMTNIIALSQSFPGVVAVNASIFVGHRIAGTMGAVMAALGTVLPALLAIVLILAVLVGFESNVYVQMVFVGVKAASAALILEAVFRMARASLKNSYGYVYSSCRSIAVMFGVSAAWGILLGAVSGIVFYKKSINK